MLTRVSVARFVAEFFIPRGYWGLDGPRIDQYGERKAGRSGKQGGEGREGYLYRSVIDCIQESKV